MTEASCSHSERRKGICMRCGKDFNSKPAAAQPVERKPRPAETKPFTHRQFERWVKSFKGWGAEMEADGGCSAEDAVGDFVQGLIAFPNDDTKRAIAYLKQNDNVQDVKGCLADLLFDVTQK